MGTSTGVTTGGDVSPAFDQKGKVRWVFIWCIRKPWGCLCCYSAFCNFESLKVRRTSVVTRTVNHHSRVKNLFCGGGLVDVSFRHTSVWKPIVTQKTIQKINANVLLQQKKKLRKERKGRKLTTANVDRERWCNQRWIKDVWILMWSFLLFHLAIRPSTHNSRGKYFLLTAKFWSPDAIHGVIWPVL